VFAGNPRATFYNRTLSTTVTGLHPLTTYFVGVRARDGAGNTDRNTVAVELPPLPNGVPYNPR
jgi:hypothetical protein